MSTVFTYQDPVIYEMRDAYIDKSDSHKIISNKVLLEEIPDSFSKVLVSNISEVLSETKNPSPSENSYHVDYTNGIVTFHPSRDGQTFQFDYKGKGRIMMPVSRIWTQEDSGSVIETLKELTDTTIQAKSDAEAVTIEAQSAADKANTIANTLEKESKMIYKDSVATYADIDITYPSPENGWTVFVTGESTRYRYNIDLAKWVNIGGEYQIVYSKEPPNNFNAIWIKTYK
jgi:hypothetical protein